MNLGEPQYPDSYYYGVILQGYHDVGLDITHLENALKDTERRMRK